MELVSCSGENGAGQLVTQDALYAVREAEGSDCWNDSDHALSSDIWIGATLAASIAIPRVMRGRLPPGSTRPERVRLPDERWRLPTK